MNKKQELRKFYILARDTITKHEKNEFDKRIFTRFINSKLTTDFSLFLTYVSVKSEADTINIIRHLLKCNKEVAIPYCKDKTMFFCKINSLNDLTDGLYGIPTAKNPVFLDNDEIKNALCIMPALSVDVNGNRLGYGGGYYDRFLACNDIETVALCYERCISDILPVDKFDKPVKYILTENKLKKL